MTGNQEAACKQNAAWRAFWIKIREMNSREMNSREMNSREMNSREMKPLEKAKEPDRVDLFGGATNSMPVRDKEKESEPKPL